MDSAATKPATGPTAFAVVTALVVLCFMYRSRDRGALERCHVGEEHS
jgi:hypothetical protein